MKKQYKTIGIVGSRRRNTANDMVALCVALDKVYEKGDRLVSGGCELGADNMAEKIAKKRGITIIIHYPRKDDLDRELSKINYRAAYAKIAYARNTLIADDCDILLALCAEDRTGGTEDTVRKALIRKKEVVYV